ncbi:MAG: acyl-ACP--UDP-N-acetylglucosamine O-acyltransferase [Phycisphaerae bacterium]
MIHPTAIVDSQARIDASTHIGPYAVIEGAVTVGPDCVISSHAKLIGPLVMGRNNKIHSFASLGDAPQDLKHKGQPSDLHIGDDNVFRESVTVHRGTNGRTVIGSKNFLMVASHVGHNCILGDNITLVNNATLGGHVVVQDRAIIGAHCAIHQFCRVGKLAMASNASSHNVDIPPFVIAMLINCVTQLNAVGLRRSGMPRSSINAVRRMFQIIYRDGGRLPLGQAIKTLPADIAGDPEVAAFVQFVGESKRGVARYHPWSRRHATRVAEDEVAPE